MAKLALLDSNNTVYNTILGDPTDYSDAKDITDTSVGRGWTWDGSQWIEPTITPRSISQAEFIDLLLAVGLTPADLKAIWDDTAVKGFRVQFQLAEALERDSTKMQYGIDALESAGYLTSTQRTELESLWPKD